MTVLLEIPVTASADPAQLGVTLRATVTTPFDPAGLLVADLTVDGTAAGAARPRGVTPVVGIRVYLDGTLVSPGALLAEFTYDDNIDSPLAKWTLAVPLPSPFGSPLTYGGPAPGIRSVTIHGVYLTPTGIHEIPLVTNGIVDNERREVTADGQTIAHLTGSSALARYDRRRVSLSLPPGHLHGDLEVAALLANLAGMPAVIGYGRGMLKEVQLSMEAWLQKAQDILTARGYLLTTDPYGDLTAVFDGYDPGRRVDLTLADRDVILGTPTIDLPGDVVTRLTLTGTEQMTHADCSQRVEVSIEYLRSVYAPRVCTLRQASDGGLSTISSGSGTAADIPTGRVETYTVYECHDIVATVVLTYSMYLRQAARYIQHSDGTVGYQDGVLLLPGAVANDNSLAYNQLVERLMLVSKVETIYRFDDLGRQIAITTTTHSPFFRKTAIKTKSDPLDSFDSTPLISGVLLLGDRTAVAEALEVMPFTGFGVTSFDDISAVQTVTNAVTPDNKISSTVTANSSNYAPGGSSSMFSDGQPRSLSVETLLELTTQRIVYVDQGESLHGESTTVTSQGQFVSSTSQNGIAGSLPPAVFRQDIPGTEAPSGVRASRNDVSVINAQWISWAMEAGHALRDEVAADTWCENPTELQFRARRIIVEGGALTVTVQTAANWFIRPGWKLLLDLRTVCFQLLGFPPITTPWEFYVRQASHALSGPDGPYTTVLTGRTYLITS